MKNKLKSSLFAAGLLILSSCSVPKDVTYMQDAYNGGLIEITETADIKVRPNDKISIVVNSKDPVLADLFNLPVVSRRVGASNNSSNNNQAVSASTVSPEGDIDFPVLGKIHIAGMTRSEATEYIKRRLISEDLVKDPVVTLEYVDTGISVMGEVNRPGRYEINKDRINILEALTLAGDLTISGKRDNVLVVREEGNRQYTYRVDLTNANALYSSPVYYLRQNDIVYVEPNNMKKRSTTVNGNNVLTASFWVSIASLATSIAVLIFK